MSGVERIREDFAHTSSAKRGDDLVGAETGADGERQGTVILVADYP